MLKNKSHTKFFDAVLTKNFLRKVPPKPPPLSSGKSSPENTAVMEHFEKVLDHLIECGMPDKAKLLKMVFDKPVNFSTCFLAAIEAPEEKKKEAQDKLTECPRKRQKVSEMENRGF